MWSNWIEQLPTPTPLGPAAPPPFEMPTVSLWDYAQSTVGWYNELPIVNGVGIVLLIFSLWVAFRMIWAKIQATGDNAEGER